LGFVPQRQPTVFIFYNPSEGEGLFILL